MDAHVLDCFRGIHAHYTKLTFQLGTRATVTG